MNNKFEIIIGWLLLALGVAIIFYSIFSSYNVFTAKTAAPEIFSTSEEITVQKGNNDSGILGLSEIDIQKILGNQLKGLLPDNAISKVLNLVVWGILAWILMIAGGKIAGIGIKLLKK